MSLPTETFETVEQIRDYLNAHVVENNTRAIKEEHISNVLNSILNIIGYNEEKFKWEYWSDLPSYAAGLAFIMDKDSDLIVLVGGSYIKYSEDGGKTFVDATYSSISNSIPLAAFGNGRFVAGWNAGNNALKYSTDGITWTDSSTILGVNFIVYAGGNTFLAYRSSSPYEIFESTDGGVTWEDTGLTVVNSVSNIVKNELTGRMFNVNVNTKKIRHSDDHGYTWTDGALLSSGSYKLLWVGGTKFIGYLTTGGDGSIIYSDDNCETWTTIYVSSLLTAISSSLYLGGSTVLMVSNTFCQLFASFDCGITWRWVSMQDFIFNGLLYISNGEILLMNKRIFRSTLKTII